MKKILKFAMLLLVCVVFFNGAEETAFEGKIYFRYQKPDGKKIYVYYVKGDKVRIDAIVEGKIEATNLVNTATKEMFAISPKNKLYMKKEYKEVDYSRNANIKVEKTGNQESFLGYTCDEYKVVNAEEGIFLTYYISQKNFDFFKPMLTCINRKEPISTHYFQIENLNRDFPFIGLQRNADGLETSRLEATMISSETLEDTWFDIPYNYTEAKY